MLSPVPATARKITGGSDVALRSDALSERVAKSAGIAAQVVIFLRPYDLT